MTVTGREQEYKTLDLKLKKFIQDETSSTIFISGVPGSGKTHTIKEVLKNNNIKYVYINAGHLKQKAFFYKEIYNKLPCKKFYYKNFLFSIRKHFIDCDTPHIFVIDEIDLLSTQKQDYFYNVTDFTYLENTKLLLICISNTMNLPEKHFESKVCSRIGKNRVDFKPYTHNKLKNIITNKYKNKNNLDVELIARRVASICGDVRKAFNLIDNMEDSKALSLQINEFVKPLTYKVLPCLSKYQKILLSVLCSTTDFSPSVIYKSFDWICKSHSLFSIGFFDFIDLLQKFKVLGIIKIKDYTSKVILLQDPEEIYKILGNDNDFIIYK